MCNMQVDMKKGFEQPSQSTGAVCVGQYAREGGVHVVDVKIDGDDGGQVFQAIQGQSTMKITGNLPVQNETKGVVPTMSVGHASGQHMGSGGNKRRDLF